MQKRIAIVTVLVVAAVAAFIFLQPDPGPCRKIRAACEAQGFKRGRTPSERRAFQENCFRPLLEGQAIHDVKIDQDVATACKERQSKRRGRKGGGGNRNKDNDGDNEQESDEAGLNSAARTVAALIRTH
jgi:hypothetical protein